MNVKVNLCTFIFASNFNRDLSLGVVRSFFFLQLMKIQPMQICQTEIYVNELCIYNWYLLAIDSRQEYMPKKLQLKSV